MMAKSIPTGYCEICGAALYETDAKKLCNRCSALHLSKQNVLVIYCLYCGQRIDYSALTLEIQPDRRWCQCAPVGNKKGYDCDKLESC